MDDEFGEQFSGVDYIPQIFANARNNEELIEG